VQAYDVYFEKGKKAALLADAWKRFEARMDVIDCGNLDDTTYIHHN
jgi:hypothetical protein